MRMSRVILTTGSAMVAVAVFLAACSASASPGASTAASGPAGASTAASAAVPSAGTSTVSVDLVFSGVRSVVAKGSAGQCDLGKDGNGTAINFRFGATEADYPGLGDGFFVAEDTPPYTTLKWLLDGTNAFLNMADVVGAVSADHHSVQLDNDIEGGLGIVHVKGTIQCP